jgi:hypothetical protein
MKNINVTSFFILLCFCTLNFGCEKYLSEKPDKRISTPDKLTDLQGILHGYSLMNAQYPSAGEISADDYYLTDASWSSAAEKQRNFYLWQKYDNMATDWTSPYKCIFNANLILETIPKLNLSIAEKKDAQILKGQALFIRSFYHYAISQLFVPAYRHEDAKETLGIPLKLAADVEAPAVRASVAESYNQILKDALQSVPLLPEVAQAKYLPSRPAAYALLARVNLIMGNFKDAELFADSCLQLNKTLIDYNTISNTSATPFAQFNNEVLYDCRTAAPAILAQTRAKIEPTLYNAYENNDLRKVIFFKKNADASYAFKGNYTGLNTAAIFSGLAVDEVLLTRAECRVRNGKVTEGIADLNTLLKQRYKTGSFIPLSIQSSAPALNALLTERRKELLFRNIRWSDLRRLNLESTYAKTLTRTIKQVVYLLEPNDKRYVFPIDKTAILLSRMPQNP